MPEREQRWHRRAVLSTAVAVTMMLSSTPVAVWGAEPESAHGDPTSTVTPGSETPRPEDLDTDPLSEPDETKQGDPETSDEKSGGSAAAGTDPAAVDESTTASTDANEEAAALVQAAVEPPRPPLSLDNLPLRELGVGIPKSIRDNFGTDIENELEIGRPSPGGTSAGTVPAGLEDFYSQNIKWESCAAYGTDGYKDDARFSCGYLIVPLDYQDPDGPTIAMSMLRAHTEGAKKKGTLFLDPGGPGGSGMDIVAARVDRYQEIGLLDDFDLIGIDPRGVGSSAPVISCFSGQAFDAFRESSNLGRARTYFMEEGCANNTGLEYPDIDSGAFLGSVGTNNVVKDLDVARSVVGDSRLNYLGYSYGTSIGYNYALQFPEGVRAMVLDAIVNPFENNRTELAKYEEFFQNGGGSQASAMEEAKAQFIKRCEAQEGFEFKGMPIPCAASVFSDPPTEPVWSESQQRYLGASIDFDFGWKSAMYSESSWPKLNAALYALKNGEDPFEMLSLADGYFDRKTDGRYGPGEGAFLQISYCADEAEQGCGAHAAEPLLTGEPIAALTNVLAISGTYDNATAYPNGVVLAQAIGGTLLSVATNTHGSVGNSNPPVTCADVIASTYLRTLKIVDAPGNRDVPTKDIYSNPITGDQCQIDERWRAVPTAADQSIEAGQTLEITASGLTRGGLYTVSVVAPDGTVLFGTATPVAAAADGTLVVPLAVEQSADGGEYRIVVRGAEEITSVNANAVSTLKVSAVIIPTPTDASIRLSASSTSSDGATQTVFGEGFAARSDITIYLDESTGTPLVRIKAGDDGAFTLNVDLPELRLGQHRILAQGEDGKTREAAFDAVKLSAAAPVAAADAAGVLAVTGGDSRAWIPMAGGSSVLLLVGIALLTVRRSRRL